MTYVMVSFPVVQTLLLIYISFQGLIVSSTTVNPCCQPYTTVIKMRMI